MTALDLMKFECVRIIEIPSAYSTSKLSAADVDVVGSVVVEISFTGERLLADRAVIRWLSASSGRHRG